MKKNREPIFLERGKMQKLYKVMKLLVVLMIVGMMQVSAAVYSQNEKVTVKEKNISLSNLLWKLQEQTEFVFTFNSSMVEAYTNLNVDAEGKLEEVLKEILKDTNLDFQLKNGIYVINKKAPPVVEAQQPDKKITITGTVTDETGETLPGVNVIIENSGIGTITDENGVYEISCYPGNSTYLVFSFIGMETQVVQVGNYKEIDITLIADISELGEVVVNGLFERRKETYTGTTNTVSGEDLLKIGTKNVLESLNQLDPSFQILENNEFGSDPNNMPTIRFRGSSSFDDQLLSESDKNLLKTDPNLPTFVLDGFVVDLLDVIDLDMQRVESITILKDAVAAAIYGSQGSNGVFVIKTKDPLPGKINVRYNFSSTLNTPDLSTYDLLDGPELLQYQKDLGLYGDDVDGDAWTTYNNINKWIYEGVDSDWKSQAVRNTITQKHTLGLDGGDQSIRYGITMNYSDNPGVMKGSSRENMGASVSLRYLMNEKLQFSNNLSVNRNRSEDSPYGSFSDYLTMPNYLPMYGEDGELTDVFPGLFGGQILTNPLLEAEAGNFSNSRYTNVRNNFAANWRINDKFRLNIGLGYSLNNTTKETFLSPNSSEYVNSNLPVDDRGELAIYNTESESINSNVMLNYHYGIQGHMINATFGTSISQNKSIATGFEAQGFSDDNYFPSFAKGYSIDGSPIGQESLARTVGLLASVNYAYKNTFLLDGSYRLDGSSSFGSEEKYAPFFSIGTGLNLSNTNFIKEISWIDVLRVNGTYGETGSVAFSAYQAKDMFTFYSSSRYQGNIGVYLKAMGNESLVWQTTKSKELSFSLNLLDGLIDVNMSLYNRRTVDMITPVTLPPSMGFGTMTANLGEMVNKGTEISIRSVLYKSSKSNLVFTINGGHNENTIESLGGALKDYNDRIKDAVSSSNPDEQLQYTSQYEEGESTTAIYAVRSLGIDPQTGQELFLDKDGNTTWDWSSDDMVVVGDMAPKVEGSMSLSYAYGRFSAGLNAMYRLGGQDYNATLLNKVENANKWLNVDSRVLNQTWLEPGDVVPYKAVLPNEYLTEASSRFVQDNDQFHLSSINVQYMFNQKVCDVLKVKNLSLGMNLNDIYYTSTIERERGTSYPFTRSVSFSLNANF